MPITTADDADDVSTVTFIFLAVIAVSVWHACQHLNSGSGHSQHVVIEHPSFKTVPGPGY